MFLKNAIRHLRTVNTHRREVRRLCFIAGIPVQGLKHDLSKYSPTEFFESVKYYQGTRSPIEACKEDKGYSDAWFHHRGRNKHHAEYWVDQLSKGGIPVPMPYKYAIEMVCDVIGASKAYNGRDFTQNKPYDYWVTIQEKNTNLHVNTKTFVRMMLKHYAEEGDSALQKGKSRKLYEKLNRNS